MSTRGEATRLSPAAAPDPGRTFTTPSGMPASWQRRPSSMVVIAVYEAGLITTVFPAAMAGAIFHAAIWMGKFHGVIPTHTPSGS